jgi:hypothetical protein
MAKRTAEVKTTFNIFNIKLRMPDGKEASIEDYITLFERADKARVRVKVSPSVGVMFRRVMREKVDNEEIIFGIISRYTPIESDAWVNFNDPDSEEKVAVPRDTAPNRKDTWFYFIPKNHRLALVKRSDSLPLNYARLFLQNGLAAKLRSGQALDVEIANGAGAFDMILAAKEVKTLHIAVTYTNNDANPELTKNMDDQLKDAHIRRLVVDASADATGSINIGASELISGAMGLAKDNGNVVASIVKEDGQRVKVESKAFPRQETIVSEIGGNVLKDMLTKMISLFARQ